MSGLEVVGSVASVLQLAGTVYSISKTLYEVGDALSNAPSDIKDLARDLETFAEELHLLSSLLDDKTHRYSDQLYRLTAKIIGDCASICVKIDRILRKLRSGSFLARVKWVFKEKEIMKLLARLRDLKLSLMGTLSLLSALKADHMMDAMGVPNPSLLDGPKNERLKKETEVVVEETRRKLASISESQKSEMSLSEDTSGMTIMTSPSHASSENQRSFEFPGKEMGLPDTSRSASSSIISLTSSAQSRPRDMPLQTEQPDDSIFFSAMAMPMTNTLVQLPQAMASVQSFYSALSRHEHDDSEHTDTPYGNFKPSDRSEAIDNKALGLPESIAHSPTTCVEQQVPSTKTPQLPAKDGIQSLSQSDALLADWRSGMVNSSMKRFNISQDAAESWVLSLPAPDLFLVRERAEGNKKRPPQSAIMQTLPLHPGAKLAPRPLLPNRPLSHQGCTDPDSPTADVVKRPTLKIQAPDEELDCGPTVGDFGTSPNTDNLIPHQQSIEPVKRMSMESRGIFTPTDKSRSVVSQHWASSTSNAENRESSPVTSNEGAQFVEEDFFPRRSMSNDDVEWNFSSTSELDFSTPIIGSLKMPPKFTDQSRHTEEVQETGLKRHEAEKEGENYFRRDTAQTYTVPGHWRDENLPSAQIKKIPRRLTEQMKEEKAANKTDKKTKAALVTKSKRDEERNDEDYYYRRDTSRVESVPGHWISDGEYSDGSGYIVKRKAVKEPEDRSRSPDRKRHLAEGALAGAGNHKIQVGEEHRGRNVVGGAVLGAIGAEVSTRARSRYREDRGRSRSRSSRSSSPVRLKSALALASEGIAAAAAVKYAQDRAGPTKRIARGRSRTRSASRRRDSSWKYRSQSSGSDTVMRTRVIERETRAPSTSSHPPPASIRAPSIHQEIIEHHRYIDHGFEHLSATSHYPIHLEGLGPGEPERPRSVTDIHPKSTAVQRLVGRDSIQGPRSFSQYTEMAPPPGLSQQNCRSEDPEQTSGSKKTSSQKQGDQSQLNSENSETSESESITEFLKLLDSKTPLRRFEPNESTERTSAQLSKFQSMRESNNALTGSMSSSNLWNQPSSSRQISTIPPIVPATSISSSSFPEQPVSPDTPPIPAIPSRLSANSITEYAAPRAPNQRFRVTSEFFDDADELGKNAINIPTLPRLYDLNNQRASSVNDQQPRYLDFEGDLGYLSFGIHQSISLGANDQEAPSLSSFVDLSILAANSHEPEAPQIPQGLSSGTVNAPYLPRLGRIRGRSITPPTDSNPSTTNERSGDGRYTFTRAYEAGDEPLLFDMSEINQQRTETKENPAMMPRGSDSKGKQDEEPSAAATIVETDEKSLPLTTSSEASISQAQILESQVTKKHSRSLRAACDQCRKRKLRCDKSEPCGNCTKSSEPLPCTYAAAEKRLRLSIESRRSGGIAGPSSATWVPPLIPSQQETKPLGPEKRDLLEPLLEIPKQTQTFDAASTQPKTQEVIRGIFDKCDDRESDAEAAAGLEAMRIDEEQDFQTGGAFTFGQLHQQSQDENSGSDYRHIDLGLVGGGYNALMSYGDDFGRMNTSQSEDIGRSMETRVREEASVSTYITTHATSRAFSSSANPYGNWTEISDLVERRRIQNRIAQRNYRKKLKRRLEDLERRAASSSASPLQIQAETQQQEHRPEEGSEPTLLNLPVPENLPPLRLPDETYIPGSSHTQDNSPWCSSASSSSSAASGKDLSDEKRIKKMKGKQLLTAGLPTAATFNAAHNIYQSMEKPEARHKVVQEGEMTLEEARKLKAKAKLQDAASVDVAALGIKEANEVRRQRRESREKKEERHKKHLERQKRLGNGGDRPPRNISTATGTSKFDARYPVGTMTTNFSPVGEIVNISSLKVNYWQQRKEALAAKVISLSRTNDAASGDLWLRGLQELHACDPNKSENISTAWSEAHSNAMLPPDASMASVASITAARLEPFINEVQPRLSESLYKRSGTTTEMIDRFFEVLKVMQGTLNFKTGAFVWTCLCTLAREILKGRETDEMTGEIPRSNKTLANISEIATLVARYNVLESMYQQWLGMSLEPNYEKSLIVFCVHVLRYLDMALLSRQELVRGIYEAELESLIEKIREADIICRGFSVTILTGDESGLSGSKVEDVSTEDEDSDATEIGEERRGDQLSWYRPLCQ